MLFATLSLDAGNWVAWIIAGGLAGFIAGRVMGGGWGFFGDIVLGLLGAFVGWLVLGLFITGTVEWWGTLLVAVVGAIIVLAVSRAFSSNRSVA